RLGKPSPVEVYSGQREGQEVWILDNGRSRFVLAPSFGPALIAWEQAGGAENLVWSPFPQRGHLAWFYPWFGGISPRVLPADSWCWEGFFYRESNSVEPLEEVDEYGLCWRGVCVGARPQKHELHDLAFELKWLTVGHSNTLKVVYSVRNLRPTAQRVRLGGDFALGLGADPAGLVLHGEELRRRATPWAAWFFGHRWGALSQPANGKAALLISNRHNVILFDAGQQGRMLASIDDLRLSGDERQELIYYVIVEDSLEKALAYMPLKDL
ncbi:MAG: hypothetical protein H5T69_12475, partial [Chloroflexi bacterium]|nr:hypothetical protein [Chloroflexota bacterium]